MCPVPLSVQFANLFFAESCIHRSTKRLHITLRYPARLLERSKALRRGVQPTQLGHTFEHCAGLATISREYERQCEHLFAFHYWCHLRLILGCQLGTYDLRFARGNSPLMNFAGHSNSYITKLVRGNILLVEHYFAHT